MDYTINNDVDAEKILISLKEQTNDIDRQIEICKQMIDTYQDHIDVYEQKKKEKLDFYRALLNEYFDRVETNKAKTQESYSLPSGKLIRKLPSIKLVHDGEKLKQWLKENSINEFVEVTEKVKWGEFKKELKVTDNGQVVTADGEIVDGVEVETVPPTFDIKL